MADLSQFLTGTPQNQSSQTLSGKPDLSQFMTKSAQGMKQNMQQPFQAPPSSSLGQKVGNALVSPDEQQQIGGAFKSGINQVKQAFGDNGEVANAKNPLQLFEGEVKGGAGIVNTIFSPLAPIFKPLGDAINKLGDHISNNPGVQQFATNKAGEIVSRAVEDLNNLNTIAAGVAGSKTAMGLKEPVITAASDVANTASKGAKVVKEAVSPSLSPEEATGQIIQGKTEDIPAAQRTLKNTDITGVKTYKDLQSKVNSRVETLSKAQDSLLQADTRILKIQQLATKVGDTAAAHNYVINAVNQLKDYFTKTNDVANLQKINGIEAKIDPQTGKGLTLKEVNDIARMHGNKLNTYNANGELASGLTRQAAENTRMGLKNTIRNLLPDDASKTIDSHITDALDTKALIDKQVEKVNAMEQKTPKQGIVPKIISKGIKVADYVTGSPLKAIGKELGTVGSSGSLSLAEIEGYLTKNLKIIQKAKQ